MVTQIFHTIEVHMQPLADFRPKDVRSIKTEAPALDDASPGLPSRRHHSIGSTNKEQDHQTTWNDALISQSYFCILTG